MSLGPQACHSGRNFSSSASEFYPGRLVGDLHSSDLHDSEGWFKAQISYARPDRAFAVCYQTAGPYLWGGGHYSGEFIVDTSDEVGGGRVPVGSTVGEFVSCPIGFELDSGAHFPAFLIAGLRDEGCPTWGISKVSNGHPRGG